MARQTLEIKMLKALAAAAEERAQSLELTQGVFRHEMNSQEGLEMDWADWEFSKALNEYLTGEVDWIHDWFKDMCDILEVDQNGEEGSWSEYIEGPYK